MRYNLSIFAVVAPLLTGMPANAQVTQPQPSKQTPAPPQTPSERALRNIRAAVARLPNQDEFVQPPGTVPQIIAVEQAMCMAREYGISFPQVKVEQSEGATTLEIKGSDNKTLNVKTETGTFSSVSRCNCGPGGEPAALGLKSSTWEVTPDGVSTSISTYNTVGTGKSLLLSSDLPVKGAKLSRSLDQTAEPVKDASLAHSPTTLETEGQKAIVTEAGRGPQTERDATPEDVFITRGNLQKAVNAGIMCGMLNYGGG